MKVYVDSPEDVIETRTDSRGRLTLGSEYGDKTVQIALLEVIDEKSD